MMESELVVIHVQEWIVWLFVVWAALYFLEVLAKIFLGFLKISAAIQLKKSKRNLELLQKQVRDKKEKQGKCQHNWVDPSNEKVDANGYMVCTKCGSLKKE